MNRIFSILMLVLFMAAGYAVATEPESLKSKNAVKDLVSVEVLEFHDLDNILVSENGEQKKVALANVLPFDEWPDSLNQDELKVKQEGIDFVRDSLVGNKYFMKTWQPNGNPILVDLSWHTSRSPESLKIRWENKLPSQKTGWGIFHFNVLLIEKGYTPYVERSDFTKRPKFYKEAFRSAKQLALTNAAGIYRSKSLARQLNKKANRNSDPTAETAGSLTEDISIAEKQFDKVVQRMILFAKDEKNSDEARRNVIIRLGKINSDRAIRFLIENIELEIAARDIEDALLDAQPCIAAIHFAHYNWHVAQVILNSLEVEKTEGEQIYLAGVIESCLGRKSAKAVIERKMHSGDYWPESKRTPKVEIRQKNLIELLKYSQQG